LTLAWNGIDNDAAKVIGDGLSYNNTLSVLDISGCRLNAKSLMSLIQTAQLNRKLKSLMV
jgi:hypothetical protein